MIYIIHKFVFMNYYDIKTPNTKPYLIIIDGDRTIEINNLKHIKLVFSFGQKTNHAVSLNQLQDALIQSFESAHILNADRMSSLTEDER